MFLKRYLSLSFIILTFLVSEFILKECFVKSAFAEEREVYLENQYLKIAIDPVKGGRVSSFIYKPTLKEWVYPEGGFFLDHLAQQGWPGELMNANYEYQKSEEGVTVWREVKSKDEEISGVVVERRIILLKEAPAIKCSLILTNPTSSLKTPCFWSQHCFYVNGDKKDNFYYRPSTTGVRVGTGGGEFYGQNYIREPIAGWCGAVNPKERVGVVFLLDYNYLQWFYNCLAAWTTEWFYDKVFLASGESWQTEIYVIPTQGFSSYDYASQNIIASLKPETKGKELEITHLLAASLKPTSPITVFTEVFDFHSKKMLGRNSFSFSSLDFLPSEKLVRFQNIPKIPVIIKVKIEGKDFQENYEKYYDPQKPEIEPLYLGVKIPYRVDKPKKVYPKPKEIVKIHHQGLRILYCRGINAYYNRIEEASSLLGEKIEIIPSYFSMGLVNLREVDYFPINYQELMNLDLIILDNVPADAFTEYQKQLLEDFVTFGGGLFVLGDYFTLGKGNYQKSFLTDLLPVKVGDNFSLLPFSKPQPLERIKNKITEGIEWNEEPLLLWRHQLSGLKPTAKVFLKAGDEPFLVGWKYKKGRVAVLSGTTLGVLPKGAIGYWQWDQWPRILANLFQWLAEGGK
jgi:uncharacterized membrane protein